MNHKESNPATFTPPNDRRHITIIVLLCVFIALGGAAVQAYRVHRVGWVPNAVAMTISSHGSGTYLKYTSEPVFSLYRKKQGQLYVQSLGPNEDEFCFYVYVIERQYNHPFRKVKKRPPGDDMQFTILGSSFHAYSTFRIKRVYAPDGTQNPDVHFVEDQPSTLSTSTSHGVWTHLTEIQKPYPKEALDVLDAYLMQEYAQQKVFSDPLYADFPIVRHDGSDPALPATTRAPGVTPRGALPASTHRYARNEFGTPESPLTLYDWVDGAKNALLYVVAPIVLLDLIGYWAIFRMMIVRPRRNRIMRGECVRCGYPLMDGLCCECGLRIDVETDDAATT